MTYAITAIIETTENSVQGTTIGQNDQYRGPCGLIFQYGRSNNCEPKRKGKQIAVCYNNGKYVRSSKAFFLCIERINAKKMTHWSMESSDKEPIIKFFKGNYN